MREKRVKKVVRPERFELPTFWFVARRSIQLSYGRNSEDKMLLRHNYRACCNLAKETLGKGRHRNRPREN